MYEAVNQVSSPPSLCQGGAHVCFIDISNIHISMSPAHDRSWAIQHTELGNVCKTCDQIICNSFLSETGVKYNDAVKHWSNDLRTPPINKLWCHLFSLTSSLALSAIGLLTQWCLLVVLIPNTVAVSNLRCQNEALSHPSHTVVGFSLSSNFSVIYLTLLLQ